MLNHHYDSPTHVEAAERRNEGAKRVLTTGQTGDIVSGHHPKGY